jgi:hypothetical protein
MPLSELVVVEIVIKSTGSGSLLVLKTFQMLLWHRKAIVEVVV